MLCCSGYALLDNFQRNSELPWPRKKGDTNKSWLPYGQIVKSFRAKTALGCVNMVSFRYRWKGEIWSLSDRYTHLKAYPMSKHCTTILSIMRQDFYNSGKLLSFSLWYRYSVHGIISKTPPEMYACIWVTELILPLNSVVVVSLHVLGPCRQHCVTIQQSRRISLW